MRHNTLFSEAQVVTPIKILHGFESKIGVNPTQHRADRKNQFLSEYCVFILSNTFQRSKPHFSFTTGSNAWENASQPNSVVFKHLKVFYITRAYWSIFNKSKQLFIFTIYRLIVMHIRTDCWNALPRMMRRLNDVLSLSLQEHAPFWFDQLNNSA